MDKPMSFEEAIMELESVVAKLESGELSLEVSLEYFQRGIELSRICSGKLDEIEKKVSLLLEDQAGQMIEKEFEG